METESKSLVEDFHKLEKQCVGYDDYINADEEHFLKTIDGFKSLVEEVQRQNIFSANEELRDIHTEHIKMLMVPFYEAETLLRIMDKRDERVKTAHTYYLEYLKLMDHYEMMEKHQSKQWKALYKAHQLIKKSGNLEDEEEKNNESTSAAKNNPMVMLASSM